MSGTFGARLLWQLILFAQASVQLTRYLDGVFLSPEIVLLEDDENLNSLTVKLAKPATEWLDVEVRGSV